MSIIWSFLGFVITMGIIVTIHEWGHYQVARWFNIKVLMFSIGFGKPFYRKQFGETEFVISQIPLGGFVKFADEREEPVAQEDLHRAFNRQSVYKKMAVVAAGPIVNLLFAWIAFTVMYMVGISGFKPLIETAPQQTPLALAIQSNQIDLGRDDWFISAVNGKPVQNWQMVNQQLLQSLAHGEDSFDLTLNSIQNRQVTVSGVSLLGLDINDRNQNWLGAVGVTPAKPKIPAVLGEIVDGGAAMQAGLEVGDKIVKMNQIAINNWQDFVKVVQSHPAEKMIVGYERNQAYYQTEVLIESVSGENGLTVGKMGVGVLVNRDVLAAYQTTVRFGLVDAMHQSVERSAELVSMSLVMLKGMIVGDVSTANLSGPISIAQFSGQAIQGGLIAFLSLLGLLSLSIGILNLLPIPVLDGGHLMFYFIEIIKGSPVSDQTMMTGQFFGLLVIIGLTFLAIFNDVLRIFHG